MGNRPKKAGVESLRLIGRLFFFTCALRLIFRSFAYVKVFSFMQDLGCFDGIPWANRGQMGKSWTRNTLQCNANLVT
jgi:hypothetical protein